MARVTVDKDFASDWLRLKWMVQQYERELRNRGLDHIVVRVNQEAPDA